jgi:hypothetical protein
MYLLAFILIVIAAAGRVAALYVPDLGNFSPLMALALCGGAYFRDWRLWLVPFAALALSDLYIDAYYARETPYIWSIGGEAIRFLCFAAGIGIGRAVAARRSWGRLFGGSLAASGLFYLVTNTASWIKDTGYRHDAGGWWQALTIGHPEFPPTIYFFRNTLFSDLLFTGLFAAALEYSALRRGEPSLFAPRARA